MENMRNLADELQKNWDANVAAMNAEKAERYLRILAASEAVSIDVMTQLLIIADWLLKEQSCKKVQS